MGQEIVDLKERVDKEIFDGFMMMKKSRNDYVSKERWVWLDLEADDGYGIYFLDFFSSNFIIFFNLDYLFIS